MIAILYDILMVNESYVTELVNSMGWMGRHALSHMSNIEYDEEF